MRAQLIGLAGRLPDQSVAPLSFLHRLAKPRFWRTVRRWRALIAETERWSEEELRAWQLERTRAVVRHAATVPYYREAFGEAGVTPEDLRDLSDLARFPLLEKTALRDRRDDLVSAATPLTESVYSTTGGSTGIPVGFYHDVDHSARTWAFMSDLWGRVGYEEGDRSVVLRGRVIGDGKLWTLDPFRSELVMSSYHLTEEHIPSYLSRILAYGPRYVQAYPSAAALLAKHMRAHDDPAPPGVAAVLCGSENLYSWQRDLIEGAFGCRVFSWYGQSEGICLAGECEHSSSLHIYPQYGLTELVDDSGMTIETPGKVGEIVATGFHARAMPLLRYRTMDNAVLAAGTCEGCRRPYRRFERIEGRLQEFIVSAHGRLISMTAINMHSPVFDRVRQFRFVQDTPGHVTLRIVPAPGFDLGRDRAQIVSEVTAKLGDDLALGLELVEEIPRSGSGKFHFLDQHLPLAVGDKT